MAPKRNKKDNEPDLKEEKKGEDKAEGKKGGGKDKPCRICGEAGHFAKTCPQNKGGNNPSKAKQGGTKDIFGTSKVSPIDKTGSHLFSDPPSGSGAIGDEDWNPLEDDVERFFSIVTIRATSLVCACVHHVENQLYADNTSADRITSMTREGLEYIVATTLILAWLSTVLAGLGRQGLTLVGLDDVRPADIKNLFFFQDRQGMSVNARIYDYAMAFLCPKIAIGQGTTPEERLIPILLLDLDIIPKFYSLKYKESVGGPTRWGLYQKVRRLQKYLLHLGVKRSTGQRQADSFLLHFQVAQAESACVLPIGRLYARCLRSYASDSRARREIEATMKSGCGLNTDQIRTQLEGCFGMPKFGETFREWILRRRSEGFESAPFRDMRTWFAYWHDSRLIAALNHVPGLSGEEGVESKYPVAGWRDFNERFRPQISASFRLVSESRGDIHARFGIDSTLMAQLMSDRDLMKLSANVVLKDQLALPDVNLASRYEMETDNWQLVPEDDPTIEMFFRLVNNRRMKRQPPIIDVGDANTIYDLTRKRGDSRMSQSNALVSTPLIGRDLSIAAQEKSSLPQNMYLFVRPFPVCHHAVGEQFEAFRHDGDTPDLYFGTFFYRGPDGPVRPWEAVLPTDLDQNTWKNEPEVFGDCSKWDVNVAPLPNATLANHLNDLPTNSTATDYIIRSGGVNQSRAIQRSAWSRLLTGGNF